MKCEKFVPMIMEEALNAKWDLNTHDWEEETEFKEFPGHVGVAFRELTSGEVETIFGYCDRFGYLTYMCYSSQTSLEGDTWTNILEHARKYGYFYFDAGGNGHPLRVAYKHLNKAMQELNLVLKEVKEY